MKKRQFYIAGVYEDEGSDFSSEHLSRVPLTEHEENLKKVAEAEQISQAQQRRLRPQREESMYPVQDPATIESSYQRYVAQLNILFGKPCSENTPYQKSSSPKYISSQSKSNPLKSTFAQNSAYVALQKQELRLHMEKLERKRKAHRLKRYNKRENNPQINTPVNQRNNKLNNPIRDLRKNN